MKGNNNLTNNFIKPKVNIILLLRNVASVILNIINSFKLTTKIYKKHKNKEMSMESRLSISQHFEVHMAVFLDEISTCLMCEM